MSIVLDSNNIASSCDIINGSIYSFDSNHEVFVVRVFTYNEHRSYVFFIIIESFPLLYLS